MQGGDLGLSRRAAGLRAGGADAWAVHFAALARARTDPEVIVLSQGDYDFSTPKDIVAAGVRALEGGRHHYIPLLGEPDLRRAVAEAEGVALENVAITTGGQGALFCVLMALLDPGDEAVLIEPHYATYPATVRATGAAPVTAPAAAAADRGFALDVASIEAAITPSTKLILLNTPNNPTGAVYPKDTLNAIGDLCREHGLWLVSDEVYADLVYDGPFVTPRALPGMGGRTVSLGSLSKSHAMTGWRLGWAIGPKPVIAAIEDVTLAATYGLPAFVQDAALAALASNAPATIRERLRGRRDRVCRGLAGAGLDVAVPLSGLNVMLDVRGADEDAQTLAWGLLDAAKVSLLPGSGFGAAAAGFLRLSYSAAERAPRRGGGADRRVSRAEVAVSPPGTLKPRPRGVAGSGGRGGRARRRCRPAAGKPARAKRPGPGRADLRAGAGRAPAGP